MLVNALQRFAKGLGKQFVAKNRTFLNKIIFSFETFKTISLPEKNYRWKFIKHAIFFASVSITSSSIFQF